MHAAVGRQHTLDGAVRDHATSSTRAARARIFATVAPRTGLAGSTSWVTKTTFMGPAARDRVLTFASSQRRPRPRRGRRCGARTPPGRPARGRRRHVRLPQQCGEPGLRERADERGRERAGVAGVDEQAGAPVLDEIGDAADPAADDRPRRQKASMTTRPSPSDREGNTSSVASSSAAATSGAERRGVHRPAPGTRRRVARPSRSSFPCPQSEAAPRARGGHETPASASTSTAL